MKKVTLAFCFLFGGIIAVNAQDSTSTTTPTQQYPTTTSQDDQDRERINSRDLPDAVKRSLEQTEYRGWLVNAAYKTTGVSDASSDQTSSDSTSVTGNEQRNQTDTTSASGNTGAYGQEVFVVELKNGAQTKTVRFDKEGKKLDDDDSGDNDQN
jgi:hypothetical protein